jgi:imidazolonepropionase-like amidohydrolase
MVQYNQKTLAFLQDITRQLYQAGIALLVGSDSGVLLSPHGLATHKEMELMQQAGLPPIAVLRGATVYAARALGKGSELGQIAVGFNADLIVSEHNPLENLNTLQNPEAVIKNGRYFSKFELEQLRKKAIDKRSFWQEINTLRKAGEF